VVGIPEPVAKAFVRWWDQDLDDELRKVISPRRLEYMAKNYQQGLELSLFLPPSVKAPLANLVRRLEGRAVLPFELTRETLVGRQQEILAEMDGSAEVMLAVTERLQAWPEVTAQCVPLFLALTSELQAGLSRDQRIREPLTNLARQRRPQDRLLRALADRLSAMGIRA
jgi:hypothetical protein